MPNADFAHVDEAARIIKENIPQLKTLLDNADKVSKRSLKIAYLGLGISIIALVVSIVPFFKH